MGEMGEYDLDMNYIAEQCRGGMFPPLSPSRMRQTLQRSRFTNGADVEKVSTMYASFFEDVTCTAEVLNLAPYRATSTWSQEEAIRLSESLPFFAACKILILTGTDAFALCDGSDQDDVGFGFERFSGHPFGDDSIQILAPSFAQMPVLETLSLALCIFGEKGLSSLEVELAAKVSLKRLALPRALRDTSAGESFVRTWTAADKHPNDLVFETNEEWQTSHW